MLLHANLVRTYPLNATSRLLETNQSQFPSLGIKICYQNLKKKTSLNALTEDDIRTIWLPLIVYDNTDQKEVTRLGENWEWATDVTVTREGNFTRSGIEEVDEAEIFEGAENRLTMYQTYTLEFQCKYKLQQYPFDTQVIRNLHLLMAPPRSVRSR